MLYTCFVLSTLKIKWLSFCLFIYSKASSISCSTFSIPACLYKIYIYTFYKTVWSHHNNLCDTKPLDSCGVNEHLPDGRLLKILLKSKFVFSSSQLCRTRVTTYRSAEGSSLAKKSPAKKLTFSWLGHSLMDGLKCGDSSTTEGKSKTVIFILGYALQAA